MVSTNISHHEDKTAQYSVEDPVSSLCYPLTVQLKTLAIKVTRSN